MGYSTDFSGSFKLNKTLTQKQFDYINDFSISRRMKRDVNKLMELYKGKYGFPGTTVKKNTPEEIYGKEGAFFVGDNENDGTVIENNIAPGQKSYGEKTKNGQPSLYCQWVLEGDEEQELVWDGGEKFYEYIDWLKYLVTNFFEVWKVKLNGEVEWVGEDPDDRGKIVVKNNVVEVYDGNIVYTKSK